MDTLDTQLSTHLELGTVSVVSLGIARKPALVARALRTLAEAGIEPEFVTTTTGRVTVHLADHVLRTFPEKSAGPTSPTCRTLA